MRILNIKISNALSITADVELDKAFLIGQMSLGSIGNIL